MPNTLRRSPSAGSLSPAANPRTPRPSRRSPTAAARPSAADAERASRHGGDLFAGADEGTAAFSAPSPTSGLQRPGDQSRSPRSPEGYPTNGMIGIPSSLSPLQMRTPSAAAAKQARPPEGVAASPTTPPDSYRPVAPSTGPNMLKVAGLVLGLAAFTSVVIAAAILCPGLLAPLAVVGALAVVPFLQEMKSAWSGHRAADPSAGVAPSPPRAPSADVDGGHPAGAQGDETPTPALRPHGETPHHDARGQDAGQSFVTPTSGAPEDEFRAPGRGSQTSARRGSPASAPQQPASAAPAAGATKSDHFAARDARIDERLAEWKTVQGRFRGRQNRALNEAHQWGQKADDVGDKLKRVEDFRDEARREEHLYAQGVARDARGIARSNREQLRLSQRAAKANAQTARLERHSELRADRHLAQGAKLRDVTDALLDSIDRLNHEAAPSKS